MASISETAVGKVAVGYHVIMACRSRDKADAVKVAILRRLPEASLKIPLVVLDDLL